MCRCWAACRARARRWVTAALFLDGRVARAGRGRRAPHRRGAAALRVAGRGAAGARDDGHRRRGQRDLRARRPPRGGGDRADRERARRSRNGRWSPPGCSSGSSSTAASPSTSRAIPGPRRARRDPETGRGRGRAPRWRPARWCGCTPATRARPTRTCAASCACGPPRSAAGRRPERWCSPATAAGRRCSAPATTTPTLVQTELGGAPAAGFFAAGEIGPVGGRSFLHGFTATVAVFPG